MLNLVLLTTCSTLYLCRFGTEQGKDGKSKKKGERGERMRRRRRVGGDE